MIELPQLELECSTCKGRGGYADIEDDNGWASCDECNGAGFIPTPEGTRILNLVLHNSHMSVKAELLVSGAAVPSYPR
jgi:DnaJ-class molecular chaperone